MTMIADLGEFGLIAHLTTGLPQSPDVLLGIGDDAAILAISGDEILVATCDAQVEDTHFRLCNIDPHDLGRRVLAVNLSDIAAMGATPRFALVSLLLPPTLDTAILDGLYAGLREEAAKFDVAIVGGNIARNAERLIVDITLLGTSHRNQLLQRKNAQADDAIIVTGNVGSAAAGLLLLEDQHLASKIAPETQVEVLAAQHTPTPRIEAGQWLARHNIITGIDVSDGLVGDLLHICEASAVSMCIEADALPILPEVISIAQQTGRDPLEFALFGGEDYELLFTAPADRAVALVHELFVATGVKATIIGKVTKGSGLTLRRNGEVSPLQTGGWDHLRSLP
jgi:thiamine-monophosphate kinase